MHSSVLPFLSLLLACTKGTWAVDPTMPFVEYLDKDRVVCLKWGFDDLQGHITFQLEVKSTGWVGFGLSPNGGMKGSDIVIGGLGPSGSYFTDRHATGSSLPEVDEQQSYTLLSMEEKEGQTIMTFRRPIQTCDVQDFQITGQPIKVIYAYGTTDEISYHGVRRGTKEVNLLNYKPRTAPTNPTFFSATVDKITLPPKTTYYHCKVMKFPKLETKHHIYLIEPAIEHHDVVHHILLHSCPYFVTEPYDNQCYGDDTGDACFGPLAAWGVGGGAFELPENVGIPIGGEDSDAYYRLEIHYNNPNKTANITDSSGLKIYYTAQLRQYDAAILTTGVLHLDEMQYNIPPTKQFHTYGSCNTGHFSQLMNPVPDLHVFAVTLHTHLAGRKVKVALFRNGMQRDFLGYDENYNFDLQQAVSLGNIKTVQLGDEIIVECTYSTVNRNKATKLGLATTDEMCLAFLFYYPAIKITTCISHPDTSQVSMNTDNQTPEETSKYETLLKNLPQVQVVLDKDHNQYIHLNGTIREMMKIPTVTCQNNNASSRLCISWVVNPSGIILWLLWIAIM